MTDKPTPYEALGAAVERERVGNTTWRELQVLAALEHVESDPPAWARMVADLARFQLMPCDWRIIVANIGGGASLTLQRPDGSTHAIACAAPGDAFSAISDFGRALLGVKQAAIEEDVLLQRCRDAVDSLRDVLALKLPDGTYLNNDLAITTAIVRINASIARRVQQNQAFAALAAARGGETS